MKDWFYDESVHVGVDYSKQENADVYDEQMDFRDYAAEVESVLEKTGITEPGVMIAADLGCGTGAFAVHAAKRFGKVYAVDVSEQMQGVARAKAKAEGLTNIEFVQTGFLRCRLGEPVDFINTKWALHHLPDYWQQAALLSMNRMLKPGGMLFLADWIFKFDPDFETNIQAMFDKMASEHNEAFIEECKTHIREEHSTFDWILKGMIERAGFEIVIMDEEEELAMEYVCRKVTPL